MSKREYKPTSIGILGRLLVFKKIRLFEIKHFFPPSIVKIGLEVDSLSRHRAYKCTQGAAGS